MKVLESQDALNQQNETNGNGEQIEDLMKVVLQKGIEFTTTLSRCKCFLIKNMSNFSFILINLSKRMIWKSPM